MQNPLKNKTPEETGAMPAMMGKSEPVKIAPVEPYNPLKGRSPESTGNMPAMMNVGSPVEKVTIPFARKD